MTNLPIMFGNIIHPIHGVCALPENKIPSIYRVFLTDTSMTGSILTRVILPPSGISQTFTRLSTVDSAIIIALSISAFVFVFMNTSEKIKIPQVVWR